MKTLFVVSTLLLLAGTAFGWEVPQNPDRYMSIGLDLSAGKQAGLYKSDQITLRSATQQLAATVPHSNASFVKGALDFRFPLTSALTLHAFGSSTGINNNLEFSNGHEIGLGVRVFIKD